MGAEPSAEVSTVRVTRDCPEPVDAAGISRKLPVKLARPGSGVAALPDETDTTNASRNNPMVERLKEEEW
jgi:hypothetical protein